MRLQSLAVHFLGGCSHVIEEARGPPWALVGPPWALVGAPWALVGSPWALVGPPWALVGSPWALVGSPGSPRGPYPRSSSNSLQSKA